MSSQMKKALMVVGIIVVLMVGILVWSRGKEKKEVVSQAVNEQKEVEEFVQNLPDGTKINVSESLRKVKNVDGLEFSNIQLAKVGEVTTLLAEVKNTTNQSTNTQMVTIDIVDKQGNSLSKVKGIIDPIPVGGTVELNASVTADVANAYDFKISK